MPCPHTNCEYRTAPYTARDYNCDFCLRENKIRGCPPDANCIRFITKKDYVRKQKLNLPARKYSMRCVPNQEDAFRSFRGPSKFELSDMITLYNSGLDDESIGEVLNVHANTVMYWRTKLNLPQNPKIKEETYGRTRISNGRKRKRKNV